MYFGPILRHVRVKLGVLFGNLRFCWAYIGPLRAYVRPYKIFGQLEGYMLALSWPKWPYWVISRLCWAYLGHVQAYWATWRAMLRSWRAIRPYAAIRAKCARTRTFFLHQHKDLKEDVRWRDAGAFVFWGLGGLCWVCLRPFFLHGSSIFEFLVLCCLQPLGCVMCKNTLTTVKPSEQCRSIFSTPTREIASCACLRGCVRVKKTRFSCMGAQVLNFWCYVACSLWDVWCAKNTVNTVKKLPSEQCRSIFSTPTGE